MVTLNQPIFLFLAIFLIPGFLVVSFWIWRFQNRAITRFGNQQTLRGFSRFGGKRFSSAVLAMALVFLMVAASEPMLKSSKRYSRSTLNTVLVIDASRSMLALDGPGGVSRLQASVSAVESLLERYPDGYFGLVIYTNVAVSYTPTRDHQALNTLLSYTLLNYSSVRGEGSNAALALEDAALMLEGLPYTVDTVILFSDGGVSLVPATTAPSTSLVTDRLNDQRIRVVAVGVGGLVPTTIPSYNENGEVAGYHMYKGSVSYTSLNEAPLRSFAEKTSGYYFRLSDTDDLVEVIDSRNFDNQPTVLETSTSLTWLPITISLLLTAFWLLKKIRPT